MTVSSVMDASRAVWRSWREQRDVAGVDVVLRGIRVGIGVNEQWLVRGVLSGVGN